MCCTAVLCVQKLAGWLMTEQWCQALSEEIAEAQGRMWSSGKPWEEGRRGGAGRPLR